MARQVETEVSWHAQLRARGYRLTPQRELVLDAVSRLGHSTPEQILDSLRATSRSLNISTVYRTLELLEELGLVQHTHLGHGAAAYSVAGDHDHVHLICRACGAVEEAASELVHDVVARLASVKGFTVDVGHFALFGQCSRCTDTDTDTEADTESNTAP
jgi:Fur family ferric uptake transcriptional regulator